MKKKLLAAIMSFTALLGAAQAVEPKEASVTMDPGGQTYKVGPDGCIQCGGKTDHPQQ